MRKKISLWLKYATVISALGGVTFSLVRAKADGYSHWTKRLLYFTAQSNIWIGLSFLAVLLLPLIKAERREKWRKQAYLFKYTSTVAITITALVFCLLLAPFADPSYRVWALPNVFTHAITPALAIIDFFVDEYRISLKNGKWALAALPPLSYVASTAVLCVLHTDFGRGLEYPYFFMNFYSPAGIFGFSNGFPFFMGSFYWLIIFAGITLFLSWLYARLHGKRTPV